MKLPYRSRAEIKREKLINYLLSMSHTLGKSKAKFFRKIGFNESNTELLEHALLKIAKTNEIEEVDQTKARFATKYVIFGTIKAPNGKHYNLKTVWALVKGSKRPHLSTAHPANV